MILRQIVISAMLLYFSASQITPNPEVQSPTVPMPSELQAKMDLALKIEPMLAESWDKNLANFDILKRLLAEREKLWTVRKALGNLEESQSTWATAWVAFNISIEDCTAFVKANPLTPEQKERFDTWSQEMIPALIRFSFPRDYANTLQFAFQYLQRQFVPKRLLRLASAGRFFY